MLKYNDLCVQPISLCDPCAPEHARARHHHAESSYKGKKGEKGMIVLETGQEPPKETCEEGRDV